MEQSLLIGLSPEQISGRMGKEKYPHKVSRTTIYIAWWRDQAGS
jgi:hypothetical protein